MNSSATDAVWFPLICLLTIEVGVVALLIALLQRRFTAPAWRRTFCQGGIVAILVLAFCELSGSGRFLAGCAQMGHGAIAVVISKFPRRTASLHSLVA